MFETRQSRDVIVQGGRADAQTLGQAAKRELFDPFLVYQLDRALHDTRLIEPHSMRHAPVSLPLWPGTVP